MSDENFVHESLHLQAVFFSGQKWRNLLKVTKNFRPTKIFSDIVLSDKAIYIEIKHSYAMNRQMISGSAWQAPEKKKNNKNNNINTECV